MCGGRNLNVGHDTALIFFETSGAARCNYGLINNLFSISVLPGTGKHFLRPNFRNVYAVIYSPQLFLHSLKRTNYT